MLSQLFLAGIALGVPLGFLGGSIFTRKIMAPSFCPRCLRHKEWVRELREADDRTDEEKSQSRHFYHLRRRDKS